MVFLSYIQRLLLKKSPCTSAPQSIWIAPHYDGDFLFYIIPNLFVYLPARSLDDFMSLTKATRKNPHEWRTPLTNALLNNNEKQTRKARQLSFVNPWASFSVLFDSSSSHRRAFSFFAILKKNVVRCFMFQRQIMTFPPWQRNNINVINVTTYAKLWNICNPQPKATIVWCIFFYNFKYDISIWYKPTLALVDANSCVRTTKKIPNT